MEIHYPELTDEELEKLCSYLRWKPLEVIKKTMENTTRLTKLEKRLPIGQQIKIKSSQLNVPSLQEHYASDTIIANVKSCEGHNALWVFGGRE